MSDKFISSSIANKFNSSNSKIIAESNAIGQIAFHYDTVGNKRIKNGYDYKYIVELKEDDTYRGFEVYVKSDTDNSANFSRQKRAAVRDTVRTFMESNGWRYKRSLTMRSMTGPPNERFQAVGGLLLIAGQLLAIALAYCFKLTLGYLYMIPVLMSLFGIWMLGIGLGQSILKFPKFSLYTITFVIGEIVFVGTLFALCIVEVLMEDELTDFTLYGFHMVDSVCFIASVFIAIIFGLIGYWSKD